MNGVDKLHIGGTITQKHLIIVFSKVGWETFTASPISFHGFFAPYRGPPEPFAVAIEYLIVGILVAVSSEIIDFVEGLHFELPHVRQAHILQGQENTLPRSVIDAESAQMRAD